MKMTMRTNLQLIKTLIIASFFVNVLAFTSCKVSNPADEISLVIKPDFVSAPFRFDFIDAATGYTKTDLEGLEVKISGPGAAALYTSDGYQTFKIVNGQIGVCVRKGVNPSVDNPIEFTINFAADGYLKKSVTQKITNMLPSSQKIVVINITNPPKNVSIKDSTFSASANGTNAAMSISTPKTDSIPSIAITIPKNTRFVDQNNVPYDGQITATVMTSTTKGDNTGIYAYDLFSDNMKDQNGNTLTNSSFIPLNSYDISYSGHGKALTTVWADTATRINPYNLQTDERVIIGANGTPRITNDSGYMPALISSAFNGIRNNVSNCLLSFTNRQYFSLFSYWITYEVKNSINGQVQYTKRYKINPAVDNYPVLVLSPVITLPRFPFVIKNTLTITFGNENSPIHSETFDLISNGSKTIDLAAVASGLPANYFKTKFSVYCTDKKAYMALPEGWKIYLIPKTDYNSIIVNGHKVQPSDNTGDYIEVSASEPITEKDSTGKFIVYNVVKIPVASLKSSTEYVVCTTFGSKGLIFNDFNGIKYGDAGKVITPDLTGVVIDIEGPPRKLEIDNCAN